MSAADDFHAFFGNGALTKLLSLPSALPFSIQASDLHDPALHEHTHACKLHIIRLPKLLYHLGLIINIQTYYPHMYNAQKTYDHVILLVVNNIFMSLTMIM